MGCCTSTNAKKPKDVVINPIKVREVKAKLKMEKMA